MTAAGLADLAQVMRLSPEAALCALHTGHEGLSDDEAERHSAAASAWLGVDTGLRPDAVGGSRACLRDWDSTARRGGHVGHRHQRPVQLLPGISGGPRNQGAYHAASAASHGRSWRAAVGDPCRGNRSAPEAPSSRTTTRCRRSSALTRASPPRYGPVLWLATGRRAARRRDGPLVTLQHALRGHRAHADTCLPSATSWGRPRWAHGIGCWSP